MTGALGLACEPMPVAGERIIGGVVFFTPLQCPVVGGFYGVVVMMYVDEGL